MYYSPASNAYRAVNCSSDSFGVSNTTYGLAAYPCRDCPTGMQTSAVLPSSSAYRDPTTGGYTHPKACVTKAGHGYNGRIATKCPVGSYNAAGNYGTCTKCAAGLTTAAEAASQASDCILAAGYGWYNGSIVPCPVGKGDMAWILAQCSPSSCATLKCMPGLFCMHASSPPACTVHNHQTSIWMAAACHHGPW